MRKIYKITNMVLIFMLICALAGDGIAYCFSDSSLRPPLRFNGENQNEIETIERLLVSQEDEKLFNLLSSAFIEHSLNNIITGPMGFLYRLGSKHKIAFDYSKKLNNIHEELLKNIRAGLELDEAGISKYIENIEELFNSAAGELLKAKAKKADIAKIKESLVSLRDYKIVLIYLRNLNDVNEIIRVFKEKFRKTGYCIVLCEGDLVFDKKTKGESLDIAGIIDNSIINAREASQGKAEIVVRTFRKEGCIAIAVSDTGPGIAEEVLTHLFKKSYTTKESKEDGGLGLWLSRIYSRLKGGSVQVDTMTESGISCRLIFDEELNERKILKGEEIPDDDSLKRKTKGTTVTYSLPEAKSYVLRRGAEYTVKVMDRIFKGPRNDVRDEILNMILGESNLAVREEDKKTLRRFLIYREVIYLKEEAGTISDEKEEYVESLLGGTMEFNEIHKLQPEKEKRILRILDVLGLVWHRSGDILQTLDIVEYLEGKKNITVGEMKQVLGQIDSNIFSYPLFYYEKLAEEYLGGLGTVLLKHFLPEKDSLDKAFNETRMSWKKTKAEPTEKELSQLLSLYRDKLALQIWLFEQVIDICEKDYGIPKEILLEFSYYDPSGSKAREYNLKKMPNIRELLEMAKEKLGFSRQIVKVLSEHLHRVKLDSSL
jgi:signal transduction histidine kinase